MKQNVSFSDEARKQLQKGVDTLADAAKVTLGAKGRNVIIDTKPIPHVTKDGVTVVNSINLKDPIQSIGARLIQQIASKTADDSGDGTTTSTVLAQQIISKGLDAIGKGANPIDVYKGINLAVNEVVDYLRSKAILIDDDYNFLKQVANISANGDEEIAELVADVMSKVKVDGLVTVEASGSSTTRTDILEGTKILAGVADLQFITNPHKMRAEIEDSLVVLVDGDLSTTKEIYPILEAYESLNTNKPIVFFSSNMNGELLYSLIMNKRKGELSSLAVNMPGLKDEKSELLNDIQAITGGVVVKKELGELKNFTADMFGHADKVISDMHSTIITGEGLGRKDRADIIKGQIELYKDDLPRKLYFNGRLARLNGGVAVIYVGGTTETEMIERKDRVDDAVGATTAAMREGIVPGGGIALLRAKDAVKHLYTGNKDIKLGIEIIYNILDSPFRQILSNAGTNPDKVLSKITYTDFSYGYDVREEKTVDMIQSGIIDPFKVVRNSIENSSSVAGLFLTTECVISDDI
jgi:chaperonin GroEL